eukprot:TRINITY_DN21968_c2_g1_i1.p1 TRINITY_DN21968_c2_g1~~TRINITY_DN21968_c2_g1_i1.p1  ORF type:complete len:450 (-),score=91.57 TRINITY_DN21968_c2_g1_i1:204-1553(-)
MDGRSNEVEAYLNHLPARLLEEQQEEEEDEESVQRASTKVSAVMPCGVPRLGICKIRNQRILAAASRSREAARALLESCGDGVDQLAQLQRQRVEQKVAIEDLLAILRDSLVTHDGTFSTSGFGAQACGEASPNLTGPTAGSCWKVGHEEDPGKDLKGSPIPASTPSYGARSVSGSSSSSSSSCRSSIRTGNPNPVHASQLLADSSACPQHVPHHGLVGRLRPLRFLSAKRQEKKEITQKEAEEARGDVKEKQARGIIPRGPAAGSAHGSVLTKSHSSSLEEEEKAAKEEEPHRSPSLPSLATTGRLLSEQAESQEEVEESPGVRGSFDEVLADGPIDITDMGRVARRFGVSSLDTIEEVSDENGNSDEEELSDCDSIISLLAAGKPQAASSAQRHDSLESREALRLPRDTQTSTASFMSLRSISAMTFAGRSARSAEDDFDSDDGDDW